MNGRVLASEEVQGRKRGGGGGRIRRKKMEGEMEREGGTEGDGDDAIEGGGGVGRR